MDYTRWNSSNPQAFQDLVKSWGTDTSKALEYAQQNDYSPKQMAMFYNAGNPDSSLTAEKAAELMGVDPSRASYGLQAPNGYYGTMNPQTGQPSMAEYGPHNIPGSPVQPTSVASPGQNVNLFGDNIVGKGPVSQSVSQSISGSQNDSSSFSGLDGNYRTQLLDAIMPMLSQSVSNMSGNVDQYTQNANDLYKRTADNTLKEKLPGFLDLLSSKGILNSTMGENALSKAVSSITQDAANKSYETGINAAKLKYNIPTILGQLANLGKYSQGTGSGESASLGESTSLSTNDLAPYQLLINAFTNMGA